MEDKIFVGFKFNSSAFDGGLGVDYNIPEEATRTKAEAIEHIEKTGADYIAVASNIVNYIKEEFDTKELPEKFMKKIITELTELLSFQSLGMKGTNNKSIVKTFDSKEEGEEFFNEAKKDTDESQAKEFFEMLGELAEFMSKATQLKKDIEDGKVGDIDSEIKEFEKYMEDTHGVTLNDKNKKQIRDFYKQIK